MKILEYTDALDIILILSQGEPDYFKKDDYVNFLYKINKISEAKAVENLNEEDFDYILFEYAKDKKNTMLN